MPFALTDEQRGLAETAAAVLADAAVVHPLPPQWQPVPAGFDRELWGSLAQLGFLALGVSEEAGGSGGGVRELCLLAKQVGSALPRIPFVGTATALALLGEKDQGEDDLIGRIANGSTIAVPAWETFPRGILPRQRRYGLAHSSGTVTGSLRCVQFGMNADFVIAFSGNRALLVDLADRGVQRTPVDAFDITEPAAAIELTRVPAKALPARDIAPRVRAVLAAELLGTGQRALDGAVEYAKQRQQFGRAIGSFQAIKHTLADRFVQLDAAQLLVDWAADAIDDGRADAPVATMTALVAANDAAEAAANDALQTHGGIGFTWEHPSHVFVKRARARRTLLGSAARQLDALAHHIFATASLGGRKDNP